MSASFSSPGRLGGDAVLRDAKGRPVVSFRMATTDPYDKSTSWWNVSLFGPRAEKLQPMLTKGKLIYVVGSVKQRSYTSNGEERTSCDVNAYDIQLLDKKDAGGNGGEVRAKSANDLEDLF